MPTSPNRSMELVFTPEAFSRIDDTNDRAFYARERLVPHLDAVALETVEHLVDRLVVEERPAVLDLMASWDSHLPEGLDPTEVVGIGLNVRELEQNPRLTSRVMHDLNATPKLPFPDSRFDVVLNVVSVDYLTHPVEVFAEVGRVLKPGGLFLVVFSNRMFTQKAVKVWREAGEEERVLLVEDFFTLGEVFEDTTLFISKGRKRPENDKYAHTGMPSDPVYAVYADKKGAAPSRRPRPVDTPSLGRGLDAREVARRAAEVARTHRCPHCDGAMSKYRVPLTPFTEWDTEFFYICFNDECPYLLRGFEVMARQGNVGFSYRAMFNPESGTVGPVPVQSLGALRDGIVEEPETTD